MVCSVCVCVTVDSTALLRFLPYLLLLKAVSMLLTLNNRRNSKAYLLLIHKGECMYVCMFVCIYVYIHTYIHIGGWRADV